MSTLLCQWIAYLKKLFIFLGIQITFVWQGHQIFVATAVKNYCYIFFFCEFIARNKPIEPFVFYKEFVIVYYYSIKSYWEKRNFGYEDLSCKSLSSYMYIIRGNAAQICQPSNKTSNKVLEISVPRYQKNLFLT